MKIGYRGQIVGVSLLIVHNLGENINMATVFQQPAGQPNSEPPGVPATMAPGSVLMYYPQMAGGAVIMVRH